MKGPIVYIISIDFHSCLPYPLWYIKQADILYNNITKKGIQVWGDVFKYNFICSHGVWNWTSACTSCINIYCIAIQIHGIWMFKSKDTLNDFLKKITLHNVLILQHILSLKSRVFWKMCPWKAIKWSKMLPFFYDKKLN